MEMTIEEAKKMLEAKLKCLIAETSGTNYDCNMQLCDGCALNYEQGNMGEQKEVLDMAIKALEQQRWIPVSERLPNNHECIKNNGLFNVSDGNRSYFGWFDIYDTKRFVKPTIAGFRVDNAVTAWMPLPQPYAESEDKEMTEEDKLYADELRKRAYSDYERLNMAIDELERQTCGTPRNNLAESSQDCISRQEAKKLIQGKIDDIPKNKDGTYGSMFGQYVNGLYCAKTAISYMPSVTPSYNSINTELKPCEDCISREAAIDVVRKWFDKMQLNGDICLDGIISLPSVTPSIPDVENNFNLGYNCGYTDAMCDIANEEG